jgi:Flp pilus assembly protein TadG
MISLAGASNREPPAMSVFTRFRSDRAGGMAIGFAFTVLTLAALGAVVVDYGRATSAKSLLEGALDSATLAAARDLADAPRTQAEVEARVEGHLHGNLDLNESSITVTAVTVTIDSVAGRVIASATGEIPMDFPVVAGRDKAVIGASASATYESKTIELSLVLDVTGSMSGQKLTDLKKAATDMVTTLLPADGRNDQRVRIAIVPFSAAVNAGTYANTVRVAKSGGYGHTCVTEASSDTFLDTDPAVKKLRGDTSSCPSAQVLPLTNNRTSLVNRIGGFVAAGNTAGHLGVRWGWFTLSPNWTGVWPSTADPVSYTTPKTLKIIVFMTDGDFNIQYASGNGTSNSQAAKVCTNAKQASVIVYSVAFSTASAPLSSTGKSIMQNCATSARHYFDATTGSQLIEAFQTIAANIQGIYLAS